MQLEVSTAGLPAERLDLNPQIGGEMDGVQDMPPVEAEALLALVEAVGTDYLGHAEVRRRVLGVTATRNVEAPGASEVVLGPGAANRRIVLIAVEIDLELALAPPAW